jgi:type IV secretion system protein TrbJ
VFLIDRPVRWLLCSFLVLVAAAIPVHAKLASEWTQIANNLQLIRVALDAAQSARTLVQQIHLQRQQYEAQLRNLEGLPSVGRELAADGAAAMASLAAYRRALDQLHGSLTRQQSAIDQRFTEARLGGLDWASYLRQQDGLLAQRNHHARQRLAQEQAVLEQVASDYDFARRLQADIPESVGQHQSLQHLNLHMNRVVTQNARMLQVMGTTLRDRGESEAQRAADERRAMTWLQQLRDREKAIQERQREFLR